MSTTRDDGGPAFPQHVAPAYRQEPEIWGMSLRDWFAGQALNALIEDINRPNDHERSDSETHPRDEIARRAYAIADAMLAARETRY